MIWLQFDAFELESSPYSCGDAKCSCDYVEIKDVSLSGDVTFLGRYCMANVPLGPILSSTNMMMVTFHSDHAISAKGFNASYIALLANSGEFIPCFWHFSVGFNKYGCDNEYSVGQIGKTM